MAATEDIRKILTDPKPLYALAGGADRVAEKAKEVPGAIEKLIDEAPKRFEDVRSTDPKAVQDRVTQQAKDLQVKLTEFLGTLDADFKKLTEQAQDAALQAVGRAAEAAVKLQERYDGLADHGHTVVRNWRGEVAEEAHDLAEAIEPDAEPEPEPQESAAAEDTSAEDKPAESKSGAAAPAAKKTTAKKTTAKKTTAKKTTPPAK
ncbi:hypothetical protein [Streptomyces sp. NPDC059009]|uniref:hypothetical protein n=1 Tax=Streptomyces sp. NPDC059009 TaxID=3346694 RepID=UPI0036C778A1